MKRFTLFILLLGISLMGYAQFWTEDFSTGDQYTVTLGGEGNDGNSDYFQRTDGSNIDKAYDGVNGFFFAGQDIDDGGWTGSESPSQLTWSGIDISGQSSIVFTGDFAEAFDDPGDIDQDDFLLVEYRIDGGSWTNLIAFENDGSTYNSNFFEDTDFDGTGDGQTITSAEGTMVTFEKTVSGSGSTLDLRFTAAVNSGDEDFAIDGFELSTGTVNQNPVISNISIDPAEPTPAQSVSVFAEVTDDGSLDNVELHWGTTSGTLPNTINMSNTTGDTYLTDVDIPAQVDGTTVYFEILAEDNEGATTTSAEQSYTVHEPSNFILEGTFDTDLGSFMQYSVIGAEQVWEWGDFGDPAGCAVMSGYSGGAQDNQDWLISPAVNLNNSENEELTFISASNYSGPDLELKVSTDYDGTSDPSTNGTWTNLTDQASWSGGGWDWVESGVVDLSGINGESVYVAFVYYSNPDDGAKTWEIDNVIIEEGTLNPSITVLTPNGGEEWEQGSTHDITWESEDFSGDVKIELTGSNPSVIAASVANSGSYTWDIPEDQPLAGDYKVKISDAVDGVPMDESDGTFAIIEALNYLLQETFETDLGVFTGYTVIGDQVWEWADFGNPPGCAKMSGYDGGQFENEDWLISPAMDFSGYSALSLNFEEAINYEGGNVQDNEEIYISTDYTGSGDPNANGTWTELEVTGRSSGGSWDFVAVDETDISEFIGETNVYLAFKYNSTTENAGTWEVDNVIIEEPTLNPTITVTSPNGGEEWEQGSTHEITWESEDFTGDVKIELTGSNPSVIVESTPNSGTYSWDIPMDQPLADDYKVMISDAVDGDPMDESDGTFSILEYITYIHQEAFDTDLGTWMQISVVGDEQVWEWADFGDPPGCAAMSGYDGGAQDNQDWLISPALNLNEYDNEMLSFISACNYDGPDLELKVSTDYTGSGDPNTNGTWTDLTGQANWSGGNWEWVESGDVGLSSFNGEAVYIAFVYYSNPTDGAKTWEIDNIAITAEEGATANITKAYAVGNEAVDVWYDAPISSVNAADYELTGSDNITFSDAVIDSENDQLVHLSGASTSMSSDAVLDNLNDAANGSSFVFYAGISSIDLTNTNNPGGTLDTDHIATFNALVSANDNYNNVWVHDQGGEYHGVLVYDYDFPDEVAVGDEILLTATRDVYNNLSELKDPVLLETTASGLEPYETYIMGSDINEELPADTDPGEMYEGQFVQIQDVTVESYDDSNYDYLCSWSDGDATYYFHMGDNVDFQFNNIDIEVGATYAEIWGVVDWDYDLENYRINPRNQSDIVEGLASQNIGLAEGYQFVSTYIIPEDPDMMTILNPLLDVSLDFVRSTSGDMFRKIGPNWVNNIGNWVTTEGYLFKMTAEDELTIEGEMIDPLTPISLAEGYQFVSYLHTEPMNAMDAFNSILNDNLEFIRNSAGSQIRKIGPNWVNNIGDANPGEGYLIKMLNADELVYPEIVKSATQESAPKAQHFIFQGGNAADPIYTLYLEGELNKGDEVAAFANGKMVGSTVISSESALQNELPVFATLNSGEGFEAGQEIELKVWDAQNGNTYNTGIQFNNPYGDAYVNNIYPAEDGEYSIAEVTKSGLAKDEAHALTATIYPNPANDLVTLETVAGEKEISIYNYTGKVVYESRTGNGQLNIDVSGFDAGIYVVRITFEDAVISKQVVVK